MFLLLFLIVLINNNVAREGSDDKRLLKTKIKVWEINFVLEWVKNSCCLWAFAGKVIVIIKVKVVYDYIISIGVLVY